MNAILGFVLYCNVVVWFTLETNKWLLDIVMSMYISYVCCIQLNFPIYLVPTCFVCICKRQLMITHLFTYQLVFDLIILAAILSDILCTNMTVRNCIHTSIRTKSITCVLSGTNYIYRLSLVLGTVNGDQFLVDCHTSN